MAYPSFASGIGFFDWAIYDLDSAFNTTYYREAGIALSSVAYGSTYISNGVSVILATAYGSSNNTGLVTVAPYPPGTYTFYGYARAANGYYYPAGSGIVTVQSARPQNWNWTNTFISGQNINITAWEWNSFCGRINEFRRYRGLGNYYFTTVYSGQTMLASVANEARAAIQGISGYGTYIPLISAGVTINASYFSALRTELNSIV